jgi:hypothetical protein
MFLQQRKAGEMTGIDGGNAMTEIALALAMAFFAIMILTMVSMGGGQSGAAAQMARKTNSGMPAAGLRMLPSGDKEAAKTDAGATRVIKPRQLIIFSGGRFLDDKLQLLDRAAMTAMTRPVLAVSPELSMARVMAAKKRLALPGLTVTTLNQHWLEAIREHEK